MFVDWFMASSGRPSAARAFVQRGMLLASATVAAVSGVEAKGPGQTYCFYKTCHRVKTIAETQALVGRDMQIIASHYDSCGKDRFNPCGLTSSGERFAPDRADNAASPVLPDGTIALVWSKLTKEAVVIRVNNAGPYWGNRKLDLSRAAARKLGIGGVGEVMLRVLKAPTPAEARYAKNRRYDPVPGAIGQFASLDAAHSAMTVLVAEGNPATTALAGLSAPAAADPAVDLASAYTSPLLPGFAIPKGALAQALIAQSTIEQRVVTSSVPPSTDVATAQQASQDAKVVTPKIVAVKPVTPRGTPVRAVEVKSAGSDPLQVVAELVTSLIDPPNPAQKSRSRRSDASVSRPKKPVAAQKTIVAQTSRVQRRPVVAEVEPSSEFRAGFTTYAEDRYRKSMKVAAVAPAKSKGLQDDPKSSGSSLTDAATAKIGPTKQAGVARSKKQAALKKPGGWQSSAIIDVPSSPPVLTGSHPRIPAGDLKDEDRDGGTPPRRVHPSALV
jgi:rare lipoprotein A (peptidoglycan hydrolase)